MPSQRFTRCEECREQHQSYCPHEKILLLFLDNGVGLAIRSHDETAARRTADRVSIAWRGRPFTRKVTNMSQSSDEKLKFTVDVTTGDFTRRISVFANDEAEAKLRAQSIASKMFRDADRRGVQNRIIQF
jgi:hypothetical protein